VIYEPCPDCRRRRIDRIGVAPSKVLQGYGYVYGWNEREGGVSDGAERRRRSSTAEKLEIVQETHEPGLMVSLGAPIRPVAHAAGCIFVSKYGFYKSKKSESRNLT
jgi:hypothetical protein